MTKVIHITLLLGIALVVLSITPVHADQSEKRSSKPPALIQKTETAEVSVQEDSQVIAADKETDIASKELTISSNDSLKTFLSFVRKDIDHLSEEKVIKNYQAIIGIKIAL
jgi:hypothetical protein